MNCIYSHEGGAYCDKHDHGAVTVGCCGEESCPDREVLTNADRIRQMSDEELAQLFMDSYGYAPWCDMDIDGWCEAESCKPCCEKWLKAPVKG